MKKKILAIVLCVAMLAIAIVGGTMAYFTDTDADVNVMALGNVKIVQNETDRNGDAYVDGQKLLLCSFISSPDYFSYYSSLAFDTRRFTRMPRMSAHAMVVILI